MDMEGVPGDDFFVTLGQYASDQEVVERILSARALAWQGPQNMIMRHLPFNIKATERSMLYSYRSTNVNHHDAVLIPHSLVHSSHT